MRALLFILLTCLIIHANAQTQLQVAKFDNTFKLQDGIYTSFNELLTNDPAFPNCLLIVNTNKEAVNIDELKYCTADNESNLMLFNSPLYATVQNGKLAVYYKKSLIHVYSKGTLCTFIYTNDIYKNDKYYNNNNLNQPYGTPPKPGSTGPNNATNKSHYKSFICLLDIETGEINKLSKENLSKSISRDSVLFERFIKVKPGKKDKNLFKFIAEFNTRNPKYLPVRETIIVIEEEE